MHESDLPTSTEPESPTTDEPAGDTELDVIADDLDTVEAAMKALDADDFDEAEALAVSLERDDFDGESSPPAG